MSNAPSKGSGSSLSKNALLSLGERFPADPAVEDAARKRVELVQSKRLPAMNSVLASIFASLTHKVYTEAPGFDTWAVACGADRQPICFINPTFTMQIDHEEGVAMLAGHEPYHDVLNHLRDHELGPKSENMRIAQDAMINYLLKQLGFIMPTINGDVVGIDPTPLFHWCRTKAKEAGVHCPANEVEFYKSEKVVFDVLESLPNQRRKKHNFCNHDSGLSVPGNPGAGQSGDGQPGDDEDQTGGSGSGEDQELGRDEAAIGQLVEEALRIAVNDAIVNGNDKAKKEIGNLIDATEGSETAEKLWGELGAYAIRGQVPKSRQSNDWLKWTNDFIARRISDERQRLTYNRKVPHDPRISPKGKTRKKIGYVGIDVSGSMPQEWVDEFISKLGKAHPNLEIVAIAWDGKAELLELGGDVHGGGGTTFECFDDLVWEHSKANRQDPDFVLTVTDGYYSKPALRFDPKLYGFLIIPGGDAFMKDGYIAADGTVVPRQRTFLLKDLS